jgi:hypothetical protein
LVQGVEDRHVAGEIDIGDQAAGVDPDQLERLLFLGLPLTQKLQPQGLLDLLREGRAAPLAPCRP